MGKKQFTILVVILVAMAAIAVAVRSSRTKDVKASMIGVGEKVLPDFPINQVAEMKIVKAGGTQTLTRVEGEEANVWSLAERGGYPADFAKVSNLLMELWNLEIAQNIEAGPSQFARLGLVAPGDGGEGQEKAGTLLEFKNGDGTAVATLLVGNQYTRQSETPSPFGGSGEIPAGRYLKAGGSDEVCLVSETLDGVDTTMENWLVKEFFKVDKLKSVEKKSKNPEEDWKIARKSEDEDSWRLLLLRGGESLDETKIASLKSAFSNPRFDDVVPDAKSVGDEATEFILATFEGFTYNVMVGPEIDGRKHHLTVSVDAKLPKERKAEDGESEEDKKKKDEEFKNDLERLEVKLAKEEKLEGWVYLVPNFVASPLFKNRSEIVATSTPAGEGVPGGNDGAAAPKIQVPLAPPGSSGTPGASVPAAEPRKMPGTPSATAVTEPIEINFGKAKEAAEKKAGGVEKKAGGAEKKAEGGEKAADGAKGGE